MFTYSQRRNINPKKIKLFSPLKLFNYKILVYPNNPFPRILHTTLFWCDEKKTSPSFNFNFGAHTHYTNSYRRSTRIYFYFETRERFLLITFISMRNRELFSMTLCFVNILYIFLLRSRCYLLTFWPLLRSANAITGVENFYLKIPNDLCDFIININVFIYDRLYLFKKNI